jgi:hypothetical protein
MFIGKGFDVNGDGTNDFFVVGSVLPQSEEEAAERRAVLFWIIGIAVLGFLAYILIGAVVLIVIGIAHLFSSDMLHYWRSREFISDLKWVGGAVALIIFWFRGRRILAITATVIYWIITSPIRFFSWLVSLTAEEPTDMKIFWVRRGNRIRGPVTREIIATAIAQKKLRESDLISSAESGPWEPLPYGLRRYQIAVRR